MNTAFIFPGQGSQVVGMAKDLYFASEIAKNVFDAVDDALGDNLSKIIFEGPLEDLTLTTNTQPALMAVSMAYLEVIKHHTGKNIEQLCNLVSGHSVGEYSALCAAQSISIKNAAQILRIRGQAMQNACPKDAGAMYACLGVNIDDVTAAVLDANNIGICDIANDNTESQIVISGAVDAVTYAATQIQKLGGRAIKLNVSGPFHSRLMCDAENIMQHSLNNITFKTPRVPVVLNVTALPNINIEEIKPCLVKQISNRVRFREIIDYLATHNIQTIVEIGPGKVLTNMLRKLNHNFTLKNVGNIAELEEFLNT